MESEDKQSTTGCRQGTRIGRTITVMAVVVFLAIVAYTLVLQIGPSSGSLGFGLFVGDPAPDFTLPLLDGGTASLSGIKGSPALVNFWGSWCAPCRDEAPELESVWRDYRGKGVAFIGVAVDDTDSDARGFIKDFNITYPNGLADGQAISKAYRITGVPETFLISRDGRLAGKFIGPVDRARLAAALDEVLKK